MSEASDKCVTPARGPISAPVAATPLSTQVHQEVKMIARVGKKAPDFEASAYIDGGFKNIKLSDYAGHWVMVCFYPGDFTFV